VRVQSGWYPDALAAFRALVRNRRSATGWRDFRIAACSANGIVHYLYDYSPDMEYFEIVGPANFKTIHMPPATDKVPPVTPWK
jgi:hypothetical protein